VRRCGSARKPAPSLIKPDLAEVELLLSRALPDPPAVVAGRRELVARGIEAGVTSLSTEVGAFLPQVRVEALP
jgi:fructose-1-phosphate kinase PfkB-like protein